MYDFKIYTNTFNKDISALSQNGHTLDFGRNILKYTKYVY